MSKHKRKHKKYKPERFRRRQGRIRDEATLYQQKVSEGALSADDEEKASEYFQRMAKKYGLLHEFGANGVLPAVK